ncbi:nucleotide pyrophosphatase [Sulfolobus acidocaldarius SUSAZ]|nr:nucleotide pyrophosphatase [Sulfolobus acidocaldarius SUSAZ]
MKVLLVVIDGLSFSVFERIKDKLPVMKDLIEKGFYSKLESVFPSLTPVALASLATGFNPKNNGVNSSKIYLKNSSLDKPLSAYNSKALKVNPIWVYLAKEGYNVLVASFPQALPDRWNMEGLVLLDPYRSRIRKCSDGKVIRSGENKVLGKIWLVESRQSNGYYVSYSSPSGEKSIEISKGDWYGPIEIHGKCGKNELTGISFLHAREDSIYLSPVSFYNKEWCNKPSIMENVWNYVSLKYGMMLDGDYPSLSKGIITFEEYMKTIDLTFNFFKNYTKYLLDNINWDLAITYLPIVDNLQHLLYGIDDDKAYEYILKGYLMADEFIKLQLDYAPLIFIVSDHGIEKIKKRVYVNKLLEKMNILKLRSEDEIDWSKTKAYYVGGGQIRINLRGRENRGIVSIKEFPKLVKRIVKNLENLKDENEQIFTSIYANEVPSSDREGDITIMGVRRYYGISSMVKANQEVLENVKPYVTATGEHGYFRENDLYGIVIIYSKNNNFKNTLRINSLRIIDIAPTILSLFRINNVKFDGAPISKLIEIYEYSRNNIEKG